MQATGWAFWRSGCLPLAVAMLPLQIHAGPTPDVDRLNYADLMLEGGSSQDPGFQIRREMRALHHLWRRLPHRRDGGLERPRPRAPLTVEATLSGGAALDRISLPYSAGEASQVLYQESSGGNLDLTASLSIDLWRRGPLTLAAEVDPQLHLLPLPDSLLTSLRAPVLLPVRIDLPVPLILAPNLTLAHLSREEGRQTWLEPGVTAGIFFPTGWGLTGIRAGLGWIDGLSAEADESTGEDDDVAGTGQTGGSFSLLHYLPLRDPRYRLKGELSAGVGSSGEPAVVTVQGEARLAAEAELSRGFVLGLQTFVGAGQAGPAGEPIERQIGYGLQGWLAAMLRDRLEVGLSLDLRRAETAAEEVSSGETKYIYRVGARWQALIGGRF